MRLHSGAPIDRAPRADGAPRTPRGTRVCEISRARARTRNRKVSRGTHPLNAFIGSRPGRGYCNAVKNAVRTTEIRRQRRRARYWNINHVPPTAAPAYAVPVTRKRTPRIF